jgi:membrane-associated phospholipid phosphatase
MTPMFSFERLAILYFALFSVVALFGGRGRRRPLPAALGAIATVAGIVGISRTTPVAVRVWIPHLYLVVGYWLPALLVDSHVSPTFEAWLVETDRRFRQYQVSMPRWMTHSVELAYLMCYPAVPVALAAVWMRGTVVDAERFWLSVLAAGFLCYGNLPWLPSRPPRLLDHHPAGSTHPDHPLAVAHNSGSQVFGLLNTAVLTRVSHQLNTFPSGHVAVSVAAAACAFTVWWPAGLALALVATGIAIGAVAGRYHYVVDVLLGVGVGLVSVLLFAAL